MKQAGFTLLELLVGLVVLGFILAGLSQGVRYGLRASDTQTRLSDGRAELDAVDRALRRLIEQADPGTLHTSKTLAGTKGTIALTAILPQAAGTSRAVGGEGNADIALGVDAGHRLVLRWAPHLHAQRFGPAPPGQESTLLSGLDHMEIAYFADGWHPEWTADPLPGLVRLRLVFPPGDPRHWPDIVVAPQRRRGLN